MHACGEAQQPALGRGQSICIGSNRKCSTSSWNLSVECLKGRSAAECNFGLEVRNPTGQHKQKNPASIHWPSQNTASRPNDATAMDTGANLLRKMRKFQTIAVQEASHVGRPPFPINSLSAKLCFGTLALLVLATILKFKDSFRARKTQGQNVKSRILKSKWFKDSRLDSGKRKLDEGVLQANKSYRTDTDDFPVFERLVIHDGEVIRGSSTPKPTKRRILPGSSLSEGAERKIRDDQHASSSSNLSRIRRFLTKTNGHESRPLFQNSKRLPAYQRKWDDKDESDLRQRIEELRQSVQAAESNRKAAIQALAEERKRSLELEVKIRRQKEAANALEEEVRVLKESHEALLNSLRKKYSSSVAARAAAALLYQNWESAETSDV